MRQQDHEKTIIFPQNPHDGANGYPGQVTWIQASYQYKVVVIAAGRRCSKTTFAKMLLLDEMARFQGFYIAAYMAQSHARSEKMFDEMLVALDGAGLVKRSKNKDQNRWIEVPKINQNQGAMLHFWSGDPMAHPQAQGEGLCRGILDEGGLCPHEAWSVTMFPMFSANRGRGVILGCPIPGQMGFEWFEKEWERGNPENPERDPEYMSFNAPTEGNPYVDPSFARLGRQACSSHDEELCLYDGKFARDLGAVFSHLREAFCLPSHEMAPGVLLNRLPRDGEKTVAGLDLGKHNDSTVLAVFARDTREMLCILRITHLDYHLQLPRIDAVVREMNDPVIYADARDGGSMLIEDLQRRYGNRAIAVKWTSGGRYDKASSVVRGQDFFQRQSWKLIQTDWLKEEFRLFSKKALPSGGWKYDAPTGCHDDGVSACLYAAYGLPTEALKVEDEPAPIKPDTVEFWDWLKESQEVPTVESPFNLRM